MHPRLNPKTADTYEQSIWKFEADRISRVDKSASLVIQSESDLQIPVGSRGSCAETLIRPNVNIEVNMTRPIRAKIGRAHV